MPALDDVADAVARGIAEGRVDVLVHQRTVDLVGAGQAEQLRARRVDHHHAVVADHPQRVGRGIEQGAGLFLALLQSAFDHRDVVEHAAEPGGYFGDLARAVFGGARIQLAGCVPPRRLSQRQHRSGDAAVHRKH
jgi:hypothetical protein